jgi:hypothetical protein
MANRGARSAFRILCSTPYFGGTIDPPSGTSTSATAEECPGAPLATQDYRKRQNWLRAIVAGRKLVDLTRDVAEWESPTRRRYGSFGNGHRDHSPERRASASWRLPGLPCGRSKKRLASSRLTMPITLGDSASRSRELGPQQQMNGDPHSLGDRTLLDELEQRNNRAQGQQRPSETE